MRRWIDDDDIKHFKGSVFVEMESPEASQRVVAEEYQIDTVDADGKPIRKELLLIPVEEYFELKRAEAESRKLKKRGQKRPARDIAQPDTGGNIAAKSQPMKLLKPEIPKAEVKGEAKAEALFAETKPTNTAEPGDDVKEPISKRRREEKPDRQMKPGVILKFEGFGPDVSREDVREAFEPHGEVAWVDFQRGNSEGFVRFEREGTATVAMAAVTEAKTEFGGKIPTYAALTGETEETYWKEMWIKKDQAFENARKKRREGGRGRGRGGRGGRRFRGGGRGRGRR